MLLARWEPDDTAITNAVDQAVLTMRARYGAPAALSARDTRFHGALAAAAGANGDGGRPRCHASFPGQRHALTP